jgi:hypothetical protein
MVGTIMKKISIHNTIYTIIMIALGIVLVLVIWQPVVPSSWIIKGMADSIDPHSLSLDKPVTLRYELSGEGGGTYNLVFSKEKVEVIEGNTNQADLILAMKATDFNGLMFQMAQGKADESVMQKLFLSNVLRMAGDMSVMELLTPADGGTK